MESELTNCVEEIDKRLNEEVCKIKDWLKQMTLVTIKPRLEESPVRKNVALSQARSPPEMAPNVNSWSEDEKATCLASLRSLADHSEDRHNDYSRLVEALEIRYNQLDLQQVYRYQDTKGITRPFKNIA